jgi:TolB-like protein/DNA-binding winged helix-turn-helix (wHTH) protein
VIRRFGIFELKDGELRRSGVIVKLPPQPMGVLGLLLEHPGELVTREQIQRRVWGDQTFVDFDRNLNVCITQIRSVLSDDADSPRFIRTIPKRGYMFLPPVETLPVQISPLTVPEERKSNFGVAAIFIAVVAMSIAGAWMFWPHHMAADSPNPHRIMLAVLPFEGPSEESGVIDGLVDELISNLGSLQTSRLGVIARTSVMRYKKSPADLKQVAHDLNVQYALEGSVRRDGDRLRVTARLVNVGDQSLSWTDAYEDDSANLFKLEQDMSTRIAAGVARSLFPQLIVTKSRPHIASREAFEAYRTGRSLQSQGNHAALQRSVDAFESATRIDPAYSEAYAALADSCVSLARSGDSPKTRLPCAAEAAGKALELDDSSAEAHNALANVRFWQDWNWSDAERHFTRALVINPSFAAAHHDYAWFLVAMGRTEQSLISLRRAIALDPLSVRINIDAGWLLQQAHRFQEAILQAKHAEELDPGLEEAKFCVARAEFFLGRNASTFPEGRNPYSRAAHFASVGDKPKALDALEQAFAERSMMMPLLNVDPVFTPLQTEPRFQKLIAQIKYP